jgi:hypothetical protein
MGDEHVEIFGCPHQTVNVQRNPSNDHVLHASSIEFFDHAQGFVKRVHADKASTGSGHGIKPTVRGDPQPSNPRPRHERVDGQQLDVVKGQEST